MIVNDFELHNRSSLILFHKQVEQYSINKFFTDPYLKLLYGELVEKWQIIKSIHIKMFMTKKHIINSLNNSVTLYKRIQEVEEKTYDYILNQYKEGV